MEHFINIILDSILYIEVLAAIVGLLLIRKYFKFHYFIFIFYLCLIPFIEYLGGVLNHNGYDNRWIYNIIGILEFNVVLYLFINCINDTRKSAIIKALLLVSWTGVIGDALTRTEHFLIEYLSYGFSISSVCVGLAALIYLTYLVRTSAVLHLSSVLLFWICVGLLFYHLGNLPITAIVNRIADISPNTNALLLIQAFSSILMYCSFIIGFIWSKKKYNF